MITTSVNIDTQIDGRTIDIDALLRDLLTTDSDLPQIANAHKIGLRQLIAWCKQPAVREFIEESNELAHLRATHKAAQARQLAITILTEHCRGCYNTPRDRELAGKAARTLLRPGVGTAPQTSPATDQPEPSGAGRRSSRSIAPRLHSPHQTPVADAPCNPIVADSAAPSPIGHQSSHNASNST